MGFNKIEIKRQLFFFFLECFCKISVMEIVIDACFNLIRQVLFSFFMLMCTEFAG